MSVSVIDATSTGSTGTVMVSGNMPAFSAYTSSSTNIGNATATKVVYATKDFDTKDYDTNTNFNLSTSVFTPTVAGYYLVSASTRIPVSGSSAECYITIYKNSGAYRRGYNPNGITTTNQSLQVNCIVYCNGSTDTISVYAQQNTGSTKSTDAASVLTWFQGCLLRAT